MMADTLSFLFRIFFIILITDNNTIPYLHLVQRVHSSFSNVESSKTANRSSPRTPVSATAVMPTRFSDHLKQGPTLRIVSLRPIE